MKRVSLLFVVLSTFLVTQGNPQVFYGPFVGKNEKQSARQYYSLEYLGNSPQNPSFVPDYNLSHGAVDAPVENDDDDNLNNNFSYGNGFLGVGNDELGDSSMIAQDEIIMISNDPSGFNENDDDEEDNKDVVVVDDEHINYSTTETQMGLGITNSSQAIASDELVTEETMSTDTENPGNTSTEIPYKVIPAFVHPIHRPSNEWNLESNSEIEEMDCEDGDIDQPLRKRKPERKKVHRIRIVKRRRGRPTRKGNRRRPITTFKIPQLKPRQPASSSSSNPSLSSARTNCTDCQCGLTTTRRIVGGQVAAVNEFPWMALISFDGSIQCGGTLIDDRHVLTAAHCVKNFAKKKFKIRFLEHNRVSAKDTVLVRRGIAEIFTLRSYNAKTVNNDIAIIRLSSPINFETTTVRPICLPPSTIDFTGKTGIIAGWGSTKEGGKPANILQKAKIPILSNQQCRLVGMKITNNMFCAGRLLQGGIDACQGDSGGPLMVVKDKRFYLAGIVSWGDGCAKPNKPGIYTRVSNYLDWIQNRTTGSCGCDREMSR